MSLRTFDRIYFFNSIRNTMGSMTQDQVDGINTILDMMEEDNYVNDIKQFAYIWATIKHEAADTYKPVVEYRSDSSAEALYGYKTKLGKDLGNIQPGDGEAFKGVGYVQVTGRGNALKLEPVLGVNLTNPPAQFRLQMIEPIYSYEAASYGVTTGLFTGKKLNDYINDSQCDYINARRVINGTDQAQVIAEYAVHFESAIKLI